MVDENAQAKEQAALTVALAESAATTETEQMAALIAETDGFAITTAEQMEASAGLLRRIKERMSNLNALRLSITRPMDDAKKRVMQAFAPGQDRLTAAEGRIKTAVLKWTQEQERIRAERQAELDRQAEQERERLEEEAARDEEAGSTEVAEETRQRAENVRADVAPPAATPSGPVHVRTTWKAEVYDLKALALACANGQHPLEYLTPNMTMLNAMARSAKGDLNIAGVKAVSEQGVAARS